MSVNVVVLVGNLTRDPELKVVGQGTSICNLRIAVNDRKKNQQTGEWEDVPNYFTVAVFGKTAENCAQWLYRGARITVEGRLRWRSWEKDGQKREAITVDANSIVFPPKRDDQGGGYQQQAPAQQQTAPSADPTAGWGEDDDSVPF